MPVYRSRHPNGTGFGQGAWAVEPFPFDLHTTLLAVSVVQGNLKTGVNVYHRGYFIEYLLSRPDVKAVWNKFVNHPFVMAMGDGSLPIESFKGYIVQDYLYLVRELPQLLSVACTVANGGRYNLLGPMPLRLTRRTTCLTFNEYVHI